MISIEIQIALDAYMLDRHAKSVYVRDMVETTSSTTAVTVLKPNILEHHF